MPFLTGAAKRPDEMISAAAPAVAMIPATIAGQ